MTHINYVPNQDRYTCHYIVDLEYLQRNKMDTDFPSTFMLKNTSLDRTMDNSATFSSGWQQAGTSHLALETTAPMRPSDPSHALGIHTPQTTPNPTGQSYQLDQQSSLFGQGPNTNIGAYLTTPGAGVNAQYFVRNNTSGYPIPPMSLDTNLPLKTYFTSIVSRNFMKNTVP